MVNNTNAGQLLQIDDADPMVVYLPYRDTMPWTATTDRNEYDGTSHMTKTAGASITFSFIGTHDDLSLPPPLGQELTSESYQGSHVNVYGTLDGSGGNSSYVIDDGTPSVVAHPETQQYHFPLYASNSLSYANHTLVIMSGVNISTLRIDYMEITTKPGQVQPIPSTVSNIPTPSPGGSVEAKQFPAGVIAAIVLSSLVMLITIGVGVMMLLRCRRMRRLQAAPYKPNSKYDIDIEGGRSQLVSYPRQ